MSTDLVKQSANQGLAFRTLKDLKDFAEGAYYAGLLGKKSRGEACWCAVMAMQYGAEVGLGPIQSLTGVNVINGRPTMGAGLISTLVKRSGRYNYRVTEHTDSVCTIEFSEDGEPCGVSTFTIEDAKKQELVGRNPNWKKVPKNMLFARAMSNGARWYCSDVFAGSVYTPEEMGDAVGRGGRGGRDLVATAEVIESEPDADGVVSASDVSVEAEQEKPNTIPSANLKPDHEYSAADDLAHQYDDEPPL